MFDMSSTMTQQQQFQVENSGGVVGELQLSVDDIRLQLFRLSLVRVSLGLVLLGVFWAAYSWIIVFVVLTVILGLIGSVHLSSLEALYHSQCCCAPRPSVVFLYFATIANIPLGGVGIMSSVFAVSTAEGRDKILSGVSLVLCCALTAGETAFLLRARRLRDHMENDQLPFGLASNQVGPEQIVAIGQGNIVPGSVVASHATRDEVGSPVLYGYPLHQQIIHISVQPTPGFFSSSSGPRRQGEQTRRDSDPGTVHEDPPSFVETRDRLGYGGNEN